MSFPKNVNHKTIKLLVMLYFIGLASVNLLFTWVNVGLRSLDLIFFISVVAIFLWNKRSVFFVFVIIGVIISLYLSFACVYFYNSSAVQMTNIEFIMGLLFSLTTLGFSVALSYIGIQPSEKKDFSLI
jgi:hypothetical protein